MKFIFATFPGIPLMAFRAALCTGSPFEVRFPYIQITGKGSTRTFQLYRSKNVSWSKSQIVQDHIDRAEGTLLFRWTADPFLDRSLMYACTKRWSIRGTHPVLIPDSNPSIPPSSYKPVLILRELSDSLWTTLETSVYDFIDYYQIRSLYILGHEQCPLDTSRNEFDRIEFFLERILRPYGDPWVF